MSSTKSAQVQQQPFGLPVPTPETLSLCEGLSGEQCMARASVLIEEYDYDGAMAVLQVAVVRSEGSVGSVEALTDFLVGVYGRYDDAVSLLESHELRRKLSPRLEQLLATSLYHLRRYDEALGYFENRAKQGQSSPEELQILGDTLLEVGRDKEALRYLRQAQKDRPGEPQLLKLIERAEAVVGKEEKKLVATARSAFKKGDLKQARQFAEEAAATGLLDPALTTLLRELREAEHTSAVDALRQRAVDAMEKGVFAEAMAAWRDLLTLDGENKEASEALGELQESSDRETFQAHMGRARDVLVTGDMLGTYKHLHHAYQVNGGDKWLALEEPAGLVELLLEYLDTHPKNPDKGFQGLVLLDQAEQKAGAGKMSEALSLARRAMEELGAFPRGQRLLEKLGSGVQAARGARAEKAYKAGISLEKAGMLDDAVRALEEAIRLNGGEYKDAVERRDRMKQGRENSAKEAAIQEKLESLLAGDRPFEARETLKRLEKSGADEKVVRDWKARLDRAIETLFPVKTTTKKSGLIKSLAGGEKGLQILPSGGDWLVVGSQAVGIISSTLADSGVAYGLPASVAELEGTRYFVRGEEGAFQLVCWNHDTGRLAWLSLDEGRLVPRSVVTVNSDLLDQSNVTEFPKSVAVDWDSQSFLMVEMSERNARKESALHRICPIRGRVVQTERFSAGLHHMEPMWGTDSLLISRAFEPTQRMLPGWFHGGMLERKGRLQERWFLDDLEFEIHTIRAASLSSTSNRVYGQYWYLDPFSGRAAGGGQALFVLKDDRSLFFQTRDPKMFLEGARTMSGPLRLVLAEEGDRLLMPWSDDKKGSGIAVIDGASMRLLGDLTFSSGWTVQEIGVSDCQNQAVALLSDGAGGWALESIHPEKAILPSS